MLIPLTELVKKYNISFQGILHVGAHECEEINDYEQYISRDKILWVEALPNKVQLCRDRYPGINIENAIVSDTVEEVTFNISNNGQSSSILEFGLHSQYHPQVHYIQSFQTTTILLKDILSKYNIQYNFLNFDIQGAELKALKGMEDYLTQVDYLYTEVNSDYVYKNCALITELDEYLKIFGLIRVETKWTDCKWGDAFYIRNTLINC
jgi:FkbM family methyltransferase